MEVKYNGTDISEDINVTRAEYDSFLGHHADKVMLAIDTEDDETQGWHFKAGDTIRITEDNLDTGKMIVYRVDEEETETIIYAATILKNLNAKTAEWKKIGFKELITVLAKNLGSSVDFYGVTTDYIYERVKQENIDDLEFLNYRCWLEGCILIAYGGKLKVISEDWLEEQKVSTDQLDLITDTIRTFDKAYIKDCTVYDKNRNTTGSYTYDSGKGAMSMTLDFPFSSIEEARRFAKNILKCENRKKKTGVTYANEIVTDIVAGNLLKVTTGEWVEASVAITHVRYDFENEKTKIWFRLIGGD